MIDMLIAPCGQLLTLAGNNAAPRRGAGLRDIGLIEHGALGLDLQHGVIEYAGPADQLDHALLAPSCPVQDASQQVVMPGFIDSHTHLIFAGSRADEFFARAQGASYQEIAARGGGIRKTMECTRNAAPVELLRLARQRLFALYANGTTTVEAKTGYGLEYGAEIVALRLLQELRDATPGLLFVTLMAAHLFPPEFAENHAGYVSEVQKMLEYANEHGLADFYDIFVDPLAFSQAEAEAVIAAGKSTRLGLRLHADEFGDDGTAAWGVAHGALALDHLGGIGPAGIAALAGSNTIATLLPATMFFSGHGKYAPAREMIDAGCALALATDLNPGSSLVYSMPLVLTMAALHMGLGPEECIVTSTINPAHALGVADIVGSLEPGKRADVLVLDIPRYDELAYHVGRDIVRDVIIRGRMIKHGGRMVHTA
jgi:imidazolonepropionase